MPSRYDEARERIVKAALSQKRRPCVVCKARKVIGVGTWIPSERERLAAGGNAERIPIFAFWLCREHAMSSDDNNKLIRQSVLRSIREKFKE